MNERIWKLAEQAGAETWSRAPMRAVTGLAFTDENLEKFAELIIQECTQVLFDESEKLFGLYSEETNFHWAAEYEVQSNQCIDNIGLIEKHFGVEE